MSTTRSLLARRVCTLEDDRTVSDVQRARMIDRAALENWAQEYVRHFFDHLDRIEVCDAYLEHSASAVVRSGAVH